MIVVVAENLNSFKHGHVSSNWVSLMTVFITYIVCTVLIGTLVFWLGGAWSDFGSDGFWGVVALNVFLGFTLWAKDSVRDWTISLFSPTSGDKTNDAD